MMNLSARECRAKSLEILGNATRLWKAALDNGKGADYGLSISLMVISIEELVKALILILDASGFEFRKSTSVKRFFTDHHIRHVTSFWLMVFYVFGSDANKILSGIGITPQNLMALFNIVQSKDERMRRLTNWYLEKKIHQLLVELEWFSQMENYRQNGFYCDYDHSPLNIQFDEFQIALEKLDKVRRVATGIIEIYQNLTPQALKEAKQLSKTLKDSHLYEALGRGIDSIKRNKNECK